MANTQGDQTRALLFIDVQKAFDDPYWGKRNNPDAEKNMARLLAAWRNARLPVIHVKHNSTTPGSPLRPGQPGNDFMDAVSPQANEAVFEKTVNSAFIGTTLESHLRENGISELVIAGLTTDHCVSTTTRMAGNLGFDVTLLADATATFDRKDASGRHFTAEEIHDIHLASLDDEFCRVMTTADVLKSI
ncbi:MAG: cysteine hydrolase [Woeseia sp.]|nr:cysteine hydrolase [Woeseia sp.]NNE61059.1 cysteine hydrolase [Woeseia sp.]NNL55322.1 cysteine hydrolase [Woeseia sp.]